MPTDFGVVLEVEQSHDEQVLVGRLLRFGGERVVTMEDDPLFVQRINSAGVRFEGKRSKKIEGTQSRCHVNAAIYYLQFHNHQAYHKSCQIVSGYALAGGIWVQHTWLLIDGKIGETTSNREMYFGVVLTVKEASKFVVEQIVSMLPGREAWG
jgi:hypothetical protein